MKYLYAIIFIVQFTILLSGQAAYQWNLKQSGSSLGGPIDYNMNNPNLVYY